MMNIQKITLPEICRKHDYYETCIKNKITTHILALLIAFYNLQDVNCAMNPKIIVNKKLPENKQNIPVKIQFDQNGAVYGNNLENPVNAIHTHNIVTDSQYIESKKTGSIHSPKLSHIYPVFSGNRLKSKHKGIQNSLPLKQIRNRKPTKKGHNYRSEFNKEKTKQNNEIGSAPERPLNTKINITVETSSYKIEFPSTVTGPFYPTMPPISKYSAGMCQTNTSTPMNLTVNVASAAAAAGKKEFQYILL